MPSTALFLAAAIASTDSKGVGSLLQDWWEGLDVPGNGEPEYTDDEAGEGQVTPEPVPEQPA